jgi:hypothetical protein
MRVEWTRSTVRNNATQNVDSTRMRVAVFFKRPQL